VLNPCQSCTKRGLDDDERLVGRYPCGGPSKASTSSAIARPDRLEAGGGSQNGCVGGKEVEGIE
jgi:hypothetical protein